jgi:hypothetical protein
MQSRIASSRAASVSVRAAWYAYGVCVYVYMRACALSRRALGIRVKRKVRLRDESQTARRKVRQGEESQTGAGISDRGKKLRQREEGQTGRQKSDRGKKVRQGKGCVRQVE